MNKLLVLLLVLGIAISLWYANYSPLKITSEEAKKAIYERRFPIILDVRTDLEYNLGHYPEAIHIPTAKLSDELESKLPDKTKGILVYCNTGHRARRAAELLKAKGYKNVRYISGPYWSLLR